jgi:methylthioribose-1-phosphate isomerase
VPFYVAAPSSTIDFGLEKGEQIPIEERDAAEVTHIGETQLTPSGVKAYNPAFDVTPAEYVSGIITEKGITNPPYRENLAAIGPDGSQSD